MSRPPHRPSEPLVVVLGSTGTGKSDLAVELARRFNGEVINADAMQMYRGLPVTTNKISVEEQRGVPHHLLGTIGLDEPTWNVDRFRREATQVIGEIRSRGRLPIVVGGSQYYTDGLLFEDHLVDEPAREHDKGDEGDQDAAEDQGMYEDHSKRFPILGAPTETIFAELQKVDPVMAGRWHPNDRRKIQRSLEIFLTTGRRASDIYAEQRKRKEEKEKERRDHQAAHHDHQHHPWQCLLLWVYAKPDILNARLDARIDTMLERGLEQETSEMYDTLRDSEARGVAVDRSKGIWQSIGFKEMEPYIVTLRRRRPADDAAATASVDTSEADLAKLRDAGLDGIKFGTRRYARYQLRWIKHKTIPYVAAERALDRLFLLDSTDRAQWQENVAATGVRLTAAFLGEAGEEGAAGEALPQPVDVSDTAREVLTATIAASRGRDGADLESGQPAYRQECAVCRTTLLSEEQWDKHLRGSRHRRVLRNKKRRALVPVPVPVGEEHDKDVIESSDDPSPDTEESAPRIEEPSLVAQ